MSRWRESSGRSSGSQIVPPGESSSGKACDELHEVLEVGHLRVAADVALADERTAVDRREHHVVAADVGVVGRVARLQLELARRLGDLLEDPLGVEPDAVLVLHDLPRAAQELDRLGQQELDPELGDDPPPAAVERRHRVLGEDLVSGHAVDEHRVEARIITRVEQQFQVGRGRPRSTAAPTCSCACSSQMSRSRSRDLASASGIPKSTASRLVSALERRGLVEQDGERGRLRPGPAILRVAERSMLERNIVELARPVARRARGGQRRDDQPRGARAATGSSTSPRSTAATSSAPASGSGGPSTTTAPPSARCSWRSDGRRSRRRRWPGTRPTRSPTRSDCAAELKVVRRTGVSRPRSTSSSPASRRWRHRSAARAATSSPRSASPGRRCG